MTRPDALRADVEAALERLAEEAEDGDVIAALDALPATLALVRLVLAEHAPDEGHDDCYRCSMTSHTPWPCTPWRAAAQVVGVPVEQP